ncbi:MAG: hypothetical protein AMXMBFR64_19620 [Myxococcales bacterium]
MGLRPTIYALLLVLLVSACAETPSEAYVRARTTAEAKDEDAFLAHMTRRSAALLRSLEATRKDTAGRLAWLSSPFDVHAFGEVVSEERFDEAAVLVVEGRGRRERVLMRLERGSWKIDALELASFWRPLER